MHFLAEAFPDFSYRCLVEVRFLEGKDSDLMLIECLINHGPLSYVVHIVRRGGQPVHV